MAPKDTIPAVNDEVPLSCAAEALEFDDANLRGIAEVLNNEGDEEFRKNEFKNAIHCYTEGIDVQCEDKELNAKLYSNRATAHCFLGNYNEALSDAKASRKLNPSCVRAYTAGAQACVKLNLFEESITWCNGGLTIDKDNQTLLDIKKESVARQCEPLEPTREEMKEIQTKVYDYHSSPMAFPPLNLSITKKVANRKKEGVLYLNLGDSFAELSQFQDAIVSYQQYLSIEKGDRACWGQAYGKLGNACNSIGRNDEAKKYYEIQLCIAIEIGDKVEEGKALSNLGTLFYCLGDFKRASEYHEKQWHIAVQLEDRSGEGYALSCLGNAFHRLGSLMKAMEYHERSLKIVKDLGDRVGEEKAYGDLGRVFRSLGDFEKAIEYHKSQLSIAKEEGMRADEACANYELGCCLESQGSKMVALEYYKSSARLFEEIRADLPRYHTNSFKDEWKINLFDVYQCVYTALCRIYLNLNMNLEALSAAEKGRAQALVDFLISHYGANSAQIPSCEKEEAMSSIMKSVSLDTIVLGLDKNKINIWLLQPGKGLQFKSRSMEGAGDVMSFWSVMDGMRLPRSCEVSRNVEDSGADEEEELSPSNLYRLLFDFVFGPISDYLQGDELIIVPVGPLCLVPFAASIDPLGRYLCDSFRIRIVPSLTTLKVIVDSPQGYHSESGALVVGDPEVPTFKFRGRFQTFSRLPYARQETEMIGQLMNVKPLLGKKATKEDVLEQLSAVALVHIATHGDSQRGELLLAPSSRRNSRTLEEKDCILTMADVLNVKVRAKLVVLSSCHGGRGEVLSEGVVGIARAFLAAGARSVLVSLWAITDEGTMTFMKSFYQHLLQGRSSSEALNKAMRYMRESDEFNEISDWSPFQLIGDDVTMKFPNEPDIAVEEVQEDVPDAPQCITK